MHNLLAEVPHMGGEKKNLELSVNIQTVNISQSNNYIVSHLGRKQKYSLRSHLILLNESISTWGIYSS